MTASPAGRVPALRSVPIIAPRPRVTTTAAVEQGASLSFARSTTAGYDETAKVSDAGLGDSTTKLTLNLTLKAGEKYSFSFFYPSGGPKVTLTDSNGKTSTLKMSSAFTVKTSGAYQLSFEAAFALKNYVNFGNLAVNAKAVLPGSSGDKKIDALLLGGSGQWWHAYDASAVKGAELILPKVTGLAAGSSATALTYSFLSTQPSGQSMTGFQEMTAAQKNAVRRAFDYYAKLINVTFTEVEGDGTGDINFGTNQQTSSAGYANMPDPTGSTSKVYLYLANNQATNNDAGMAEGGYGWMTALHEIGHTLGLKHPGNYNASGGGTPGPYLSASEDDHGHTIMSYKNSDATRGVNPTTPMLYDVAALQYLYGANKNATTSIGGAFTFQPGSHLQTLWSTNGSDTIDLSQLTRASDVDLNAGAYSNIDITGPAANPYYSGNKNVAIAYGAAINKVVLSSASGVAETVALNKAYASDAFDTVGSFDAGADKIVLKKSVFGALAAKNIEFGTAATTTASKIIVNTSTGEIFYDADGSGTKSAARKIAQYSVLSGSGSVSVSNFSFAA